MSAEPLDVGLKIRIVPKNRVLDDDIASLANDENWLVARVIEGGGTTPDEFIVSTQDKQSFVHWISDPKINVVYLLATGPRRAALADVVRGAFEAYSVPEVIEMAHAATDRVSRMRAIYYLALLAPDEFDDSIFQVFKSYATADDPEVRGATVLAVSYIGWPRFEEILTPVAKEDTDSSVRQDAATLLDNMKTYPARSIVPR